VLLRHQLQFIAADDAQWLEIGKVCVDADLSGRAIESIAGNIRSIIQDFEYPDDYFRADFDTRAKLVHQLSRRIDAAKVGELIAHYVEFQKDAEEKSARHRFEQEVDTMVRQLNAGREATARAAEAAARAITGE
jgi:hypothetical protein